VSDAAELSESVESVALRAVCYVEVFNFSSVGPRVDGREIFDDLASEHPTVCLATMFASFAFDAWDWRLVEARGEDELQGDAGRLARLLCETEDWRTEAALHALAAGGGPGWPRSVPAGLALRIAERWEAVEEAANRWRALGIATTREDVELTFLDAAAAASGRSRSDVHGDLLALRYGES
jgi:hypothetical protein